MTITATRKAARAAYAEQLKNPAPKAAPIQFYPSQLQAQAINYEKSPPRCETCQHFRGEKTLLNKHTTKRAVIVLPALCQRGRFNTKHYSICDYWLGHDGAKLDS